ncbi:MAG: sigma-54 dependent transcriptional regulator [Acidobacteriota bacterium]|jgi:DNA-binding NtrC family response regulator|nr:sigma-54 dependent transcriptional regulator [Acidobacteriota bacterium]
MNPKRDAKILVVDDEDYMREVVRRALENADFEVDEAADGKAALSMLRQYPYSVIITDLRMPGLTGEAILEEALSLFPETIVIVMTGFGNIQSAVEAIRRGAYDYLPKPFQLAELVMRVEKGLEEQHLKSENRMLRDELQEKYQFSNLVGGSAAMQNIYRLIGVVSQKTSTVLIEGETGTGKELIARAIHYNSPRKDQPLVSVNCGAIPSNLLEDELFGHVKGAFTNAHQHRIGRFEQANHGTLFLDEVSNMPMDLQVKLLRVLQEREFQRVGSATTVKVDVRIVAATNGDLLEQVEKGEFRSDLYYRLNVIPIRVPPLRQRRDDVPSLVTHFTRKYCADQKLSLKRVSNEAMKNLMSYEWPGNVRQLENAVEMAVALSGDRELLDVEDFPVVARVLAPENAPMPSISIPEEGINFNTMVSDLERRLILQSLEAAKGNKKRAASLLQLKRTTFVEKLRRMGMESSDSDADSDYTEG